MGRMKELLMEQELQKMEELDELFHELRDKPLSELTNMLESEISTQTKDVIYNILQIRKDKSETDGDLYLYHRNP